MLLLAALAFVTFTSCFAGSGKPLVRENTLRYGFTTEPGTFDPLSPANTADGRSILFNVFEGLVKPDSSGILIPALAQSFTVSGSVYEFILRDGIKFHDGQVLNARDVVFSLNTAAAVGFAELNRIQSIEIDPDNNRQIRIRLKSPDPEFLPFLTVGIVPENNTDRERNPIGTGPYIIANYAPQQFLTLEKNPHYWQSGVPSIDTVTIVFSASSDALVTGLRGGNLDGTGVTGSMLSQFRENEIDVFPSFSNSVQLVALNNARKPLDDIRVRQALNYAVDVPEIIETAFHGHGKPSGSPLIPALTHVYDERLHDPFPRNIDRAKRLLAEAGYPSGFPLTITVPSNFTMHVDTAQVLVNQLSSIGIDVSLRLVDWGTWLSDVYSARNYEATIISLDAPSVAPRSFLSRYYSTAGSNFLNFVSTDFDRVFDAILIEADESKRRDLYKEAQHIISRDAASIFIQDILGFKIFAKGEIGGVRNYPLYVTDFASMYRLSNQER